MGTVFAKERNVYMRNVHQEMPKKNDYAPDTSKEKDGLHKEHKINPDNLLKMNVKVERIHVDGLGRTKDDVVKSQVTELFKAKNFEDVIKCVHRVQGKLEALGCFKRIGIFIDTSHGPHATPEGIEVTFLVREMKRLMGGISTMVGNDEGSVTVGAEAPNLFGRGERMQMEYSYGSKSSTNMNVSLIKPLVNSWIYTILTGRLFNTSSDFPWSGYSQFDKGLLLDVNINPDRAGILKNQLQYEAAFRNITTPKQVSLYVREQRGPSLKSALRHIFSYDKRDSQVFPTVGNLVQFSTEVAGLGGDIGFIKSELTMQTNWTPHEFFTFQLGLKSGQLREISNDMKINIADQFFLGGPMNVRGFEMRGCGPRDDGNAIGGDAYWAAALHVYTPLPFITPGPGKFSDFFRLHGFINGGNVSNFTFKFANDYKENMKIFTESVRFAAGAGIVMRIGGIARIELNYVTPLLFLTGDRLQKFQFGIGLQYL